MSLAFLAKKSWHTANLKNVEKVWIAEQKHAQEEKKLTELRKQIEEERQLKELRELQAASGNKKAAQEKLDWMYEGPKSHRTNTEDYLLGKKYSGESNNALGDLASNSIPGALWSNSSTTVNDSFSRLHEDPMLLIKQRKIKAQENILKNPVKMQRIKKQVQEELAILKKKKKSSKGEKKKKKHKQNESDDHKKKRHKSNLSEKNIRSSRSISRSSSRERVRRSIERTKVTLKDKRSNSRRRSSSHYRSSSLEKPKYYPSRGSSFQSRRSRSPPRNRRYSPSRRERYSPSKRDTYSPSKRDTYSPTKNSRSSRSQQKSPQHQNRDSYKEKIISKKDDDNKQQLLDRDMKSSSDIHEYKNEEAKAKYGLKHTLKAEKCVVDDTSTLGPSIEFLNKVRKAKELEEKEKLARLFPKKKELTQEEKEMKIKEMQQNALQVEKLQMQHAKKEPETEEVHTAQERQAPFLTKMTRSVYMESKDTMEERLHRNKHYVQKNSNSHNFLKK